MSQMIAPDVPYTMPDARQGMCVAFYKPNVLQHEPPMLGWVSTVNRTTKRSVTVTIPGFGVYDGVRHISDPKLQASPEQRENGAWDYSPEQSVMEDRLTAIEVALAEIQHKLRSGGKKVQQQLEE